MKRLLASIGMMIVLTMPVCSAWGASDPNSKPSIHLSAATYESCQGEEDANILGCQCTYQTQDNNPPMTFTRYTTVTQCNPTDAKRCVMLCTEGLTLAQQF